MFIRIGFTIIALSDIVSSTLPSACIVSLWIYSPKECDPMNTVIHTRCPIINSLCASIKLNALVLTGIYPELDTSLTI